MASRILSQHFYVFPPRPRPRLLSVSKTRSIPGDGSYSHPDLNEITEIEPGQLYLSGCQVVTPSNLISVGITAVVRAMTQWEVQRAHLNDRTPPSVQILSVPVMDTENTDIGVYFDSVVKFIDEELKKGGKVLVHCAAGVSRSVTLILAYMITRGYTLLDAFNLVAEKRKIAWPNDGFYRQLIRYERSSREKKNGITYPYRTTSLPPNTQRTRSRSPAMGRSPF